jgi:hypothetical protein
MYTKFSTLAISPKTITLLESSPAQLRSYLQVIVNCNPVAFRDRRHTLGTLSDSVSPLQESRDGVQTKQRARAPISVCWHCVLGRCLLRTAHRPSATCLRTRQPVEVFEPLLARRCDRSLLLSAEWRVPRGDPCTTAAARLVLRMPAAGTIGIAEVVAELGDVPCTFCGEFALSHSPARAPLLGASPAGTAITLRQSTGYR